MQITKPCQTRRKENLCTDLPTFFLFVIESQNACSPHPPAPVNDLVELSLCLAVLERVVVPPLPVPVPVVVHDHLDVPGAPLTLEVLVEHGQDAEGVRKAGGLGQEAHQQPLVFTHFFKKLEGMIYMLLLIPKVLSLLVIVHFQPDFRSVSATRNFGHVSKF